MSKIPELIDTFFIVLRKKPLMFMHWYHHALTGYFAFVTFYEENAYMVWVVWLNYFIHSFMYRFVNILELTVILFQEHSLKDVILVSLYTAPVKIFPENFSYYCARALHFRVPPQFAQILTGAQIVQVCVE